MPQNPRDQTRRTMGQQSPKGSPAPRSLKQDRAGQTRLQLLDATVECLTQVGYARTTTTLVQKRAGVSRGALLYHFPSKAALLVEAVRHLVHLTGQHMKDQVDALPAQDGDRIEKVLELLWETFSGPLFYVAMELWNASRTDPKLWQVLVEAERSLGREIHSQISDVFGPQVSSRPGFKRALRMTLQWMRGAAMTEIIRKDPEKAGAELKRWREIFINLLED